MTILSKIARMWTQKGLYGVVGAAYMKYLRPNIPKRVNNYNGVKVPNGRLFDQIVPFPEGDRPEYESGIVNSLCDIINENDKVTIVGGGWGVTSVIAARQLGKDGKVTVYEGSKRHAKIIRKIVDINEVNKKVTVNHAIVGKKVKLKGNSQGAVFVKPTEIEECDVLELDCEGSERMILEEMKMRPRNIIVETHGHRNSPTSLIKEILETNSYHVIRYEIASLDRYKHCKDKDIKVIAAKLKNNNP
jgi:hypothetical protein